MNSKMIIIIICVIAIIFLLAFFSNNIFDKKTSPMPSNNNLPVTNQVNNQQENQNNGEEEIKEEVKEEPKEITLEDIYNDYKSMDIPQKTLNTEYDLNGIKFYDIDIAKANNDITIIVGKIKNESKAKIKTGDIFSLKLHRESGKVDTTGVVIEEEISEGAEGSFRTQ